MTNKVKLTPEQRFWAKVNKTDSCWLWTGSTSDFGPDFWELEMGKLTKSALAKLEEK